jgi:hypothetical protein
MRAVTKRRWIAALRSGKFTQGKGKLKQVNGPETTHCCLGVLREISKPVKKNPGSELLLPESCGMSIDFQRTLAGFNDNAPGDPDGGHKTFKGIARWLEKNLTTRG